MEFTVDTSDDWSAQGMLKIDNSEYNGYSGEMQKAPNICVYSNGVLIGGTEPDGTTPIVSAGAGDLNKDGKITVADIVLLQKYLVKKDAEISDKSAADVDKNGKVNIFDAVKLKRMIINSK